MKLELNWRSVEEWSTLAQVALVTVGEQFYAGPEKPGGSRFGIVQSSRENLRHFGSAALDTVRNRGKRTEEAEEATAPQALSEDARESKNVSKVADNAFLAGTAIAAVSIFARYKDLRTFAEETVAYEINKPAGSVSIGDVFRSDNLIVRQEAGDWWRDTLANVGTKASYLISTEAWLATELTKYIYNMDFGANDALKELEPLQDDRDFGMGTPTGEHVSRLVRAYQRAREQAKGVEPASPEVIAEKMPLFERMAACYLDPKNACGFAELIHLIGSREDAIQDTPEFHAILEHGLERASAMRADGAFVFDMGHPIEMTEIAHIRPNGVEEAPRSSHHHRNGHDMSLHPRTPMEYATRSPEAWVLQ